MESVGIRDPIEFRQLYKQTLDLEARLGDRAARTPNTQSTIPTIPTRSSIPYPSNNTTTRIEASSSNRIKSTASQQKVKTVNTNMILTDSELQTIGISATAPHQNSENVFELHTNDSDCSRQK